MSADGRKEGSSQIVSQADGDREGFGIAESNNEESSGNANIRRWRTRRDDREAIIGKREFAKENGTIWRRCIMASIHRVREMGNRQHERQSMEETAFLSIGFMGDPEEGLQKTRRCIHGRQSELLRSARKHLERR